MNQELIERLRARAKTTDHSTGDPLCAEAADALEGGVTVTDEMVRAASMRLITALPNEAVGAIHKADYSLDDIAAAVVRSALSAPAQRVEEGKIGGGDVIALVDPARWDYADAPQMAYANGYNDALAASPAPAPHTGVDTLERACDAVEDYCSDMPDLAGHGHSVGLKEAIRAALEDRT